MHWSKASVTPSVFAISPADPSRLYAAFSYRQSPDSGDGCPVQVSTSVDAGQTWTSLGDPTGVAGAGPYEINYLLADPVVPDIFYAGLTSCGDGSIRVIVDSGGTAAPVAPPAGVADFEVSTDTHEPRLLVARSSGQPADRIYLSADHGSTWRAATCPGDLRGTCPAFVMDNVFGAGQSYAFGRDGIHPFRGGGPAGTRLAISDRLPVPIAQVIDVGAGIRQGDPVYLLTKGVPCCTGALIAARPGSCCPQDCPTWHRLAPRPGRCWSVPRTTA